MFEYFSDEELACPCGCGGKMQQNFMYDVVIPMRQALGFPFKIPRGGAFRCESYDGKPNGAHSRGRALDVICNSRERYLIIEWLFKHQANRVNRIGINNGSIHFDDMQATEGKAVQVCWDYYK